MRHVVPLQPHAAPKQRRVGTSQPRNGVAWAPSRSPSAIRDGPEPGPDRRCGWFTPALVGSAASRWAPAHRPKPAARKRLSLYPPIGARGLAPQNTYLCVPSMNTQPLPKLGACALRTTTRRATGQQPFGFTHLFRVPVRDPKRMREVSERITARDRRHRARIPIERSARPTVPGSPRAGTGRPGCSRATAPSAQAVRSNH